MEIKNTADLRQALIEQLSQLREKKIDVKEAHQFTSTAREIVKLARLDLDYMKYTRRDSTEGPENPLIVKPILLIANQ